MKDQGGWAARWLVAGLCCYALCQWLFLATIARCSLVNRQHGAQVEEFRAFTAAVGDEVESACGSGLRVLFSDNDVATPYLVGRIAGLRGCQVVRETTVTPFSPADLLDCSAILLSEEHLPDTPGAGSGAWTGLGLRPVGRWRSTAGHFGYETFRNPQCPARGRP
ncbi:MAG TPA: hypothetical protein VGD62_02975 [Acidobacteriaceae bacterium]